ncbi:membrane-associated tyrosine- and threonine-specific cdc2-inhibitory kinase-like [Penaeus indicus]|uniref:membrane-associated tyrosine- and threonine-specific cdc2-inhibitory kinase-like n=1 Tax=Penaeus indicus TaxID=29960 RepID=UPI00300DB889
MILVGGNDTSFQRPAPVFVPEHRTLSTKKSRGTPKFAPPPKAPVKSCPVTRIFPRISDYDRPQPVSFRDDSDTSFIVQSPLYSAEKTALYFEQCYTIEEKLGVGSFGEVYRVRSKEDGRQYACKRTLLRFRGEGDRRRRMEEVQKHEKLPKHKNCVEFYRAWEERQHLYLLTEVCRTSLADMAEDRHDLPESVVWDYLVDLLQGVSHLHKHHLVHMDIKPENIFIGYDGLCKLGDFGLVIETSQGPVKEAMEGDPKYLAPEVMNLQFGASADIFSLGMTVLELATDLDLPKQGDMWQSLRQGKLPPVANSLSSDLQAVLTELLRPDPSERLTADQALNLPIIRHILFRKRVKDIFRISLMKAKGFLLRIWLYVMSFFAFVALPITRLRKRRRSSGDSPNKSRMNNSDSDFTMGFSDEEGLDDHSLAQPLSDISTSSSETNQFLSNKRFGNSTPISSLFKKRPDFFEGSPSIRNSCNASPRIDDSPTFIRRRITLPRAGRPFNQRLNESTSFNSSMANTPSPHRNVVEQEEPAQPLNLTSRNLIDLFNAAESDEE